MTRDEIFQLVKEEMEEKAIAETSRLVSSPNVRKNILLFKLRL